VRLNYWFCFANLLVYSLAHMSELNVYNGSSFVTYHTRSILDRTNKTKNMKWKQQKTTHRTASFKKWHIKSSHIWHQITRKMILICLTFSFISLRLLRNPTSYWLVWYFLLLFQKRLVTASSTVVDRKQQCRLCVTEGSSAAGSGDGESHDRFLYVGQTFVSS
jgi:hypothetical protein